MIQLFLSYERYYSLDDTDKWKKQGKRYRAQKEFGVYECTSYIAFHAHY